MPWTVRLHIDSSFAEISAINIKSNTNLSQIWYLAKQSIKDGVESFFNSHPQIETKKIRVSNSLALHMLEKLAGDPPALIVTSGFESWPFVRQPAVKQGNTTHPKRKNSLLTRDLVFGVSERINSSGELIQKVDIQEIEFLCSKLQFTNTKHVAVGFLNSVKNPENERQVGHYLREKGFSVSLSTEFQLPDNDEAPNEVARWWRTYMDAYLKPLLHETLQPFHDWAKTKEINIEHYSPENKLPCHIDMLFSHESESSSENENSRAVLLFGLHGFRLLKSKAKMRVIETSLGPVLSYAPELSELPLQPTQEVFINSGKTVDFSEHIVGLEPGPVLFNRSLRPTLLDVLSLNNSSMQEHLLKIKGLNSAGFDKAKTAFQALSRSTKCSEDEVLSYLQNEFIERTKLFLRREGCSEIICKGFLARPIHELIKPRLKEFKLILEENS